MKREKVIIMGAAGRDFHNFNVYFRDNDLYEVIAFTATQIPDIEGRRYPAEISGSLYPEGIPIYSESELSRLIRENKADQVVFAYSDIAHLDVMHKASTVTAAGADFRIMGPGHTQIKSKVPVVSVCAVRTGVGKSQTTRKVCSLLKKEGVRVVAVRHPMPYGDLRLQISQRFATMKDLDDHKCTIEEREEYAPHIERGIIVYAGVDYEKILRQAEKEADIIVWDGGNNDFPFYRSDLQIVLVDPLRAGHEVAYFPGETNLKTADVVIINKIDSANQEGIARVKESIRINNPEAMVIEAISPVSVDDSEALKGRTVLVVEDGPTLTHGDMGFGAGILAAKKYGALEIADPRPYAVGTIRDTYRKFHHLQNVLPAMGYSRKQIRELKETIDATPADLVVIGTPVDLRLVTEFSKPAVRVTYELEEVGKLNLEQCLKPIISSLK
jgi:predicted GTPase